jgi:hypothetical protein
MTEWTSLAYSTDETSVGARGRITRKISEAAIATVITATAVPAEQQD